MPRNQKKAQVKESRAHETRIAGLVGGKRLPASGALRWGDHGTNITAGGDISSPRFHIEHKYTQRTTLTFQLEWLLKVSEGAKRVSKHPAMVFSFTPPSGGKAKIAPVDKVLLPLEVAQRYFSALPLPWGLLVDPEALALIVRIPTTKASAQVHMDHDVAIFEFTYKDGYDIPRQAIWLLMPFRHWISIFKGE